MYNIDENKLQSIVENSNFSTEPDVDRQIKKSFIAFFSEMTNYTKSVNERILNNTLSSDHKSVILEILQKHSIPYEYDESEQTFTIYGYR